MRTIRIRVVLFQDSDWWCAQCLEYDIAAQAKSILDIRTELERVLRSHVIVSAELGREPFAGLPPAPQKFFDAFDSSESPIEDTADSLIEPVQSYSLPSILPALKFAECRTN